MVVPVEKEGGGAVEEEGVGVEKAAFRSNKLPAPAPPAGAEGPSDKLARSSSGFDLAPG